MAYQLHLHEENEILLVKISGEREKKELVSTARDAWREIAKRSSEKGLRKIMVVSSATGHYPVWDAFLINSRLDECGVQKSWKIAFVNLDKESFPDVKFAETVAANRGFNLGVFGQEEEARIWLSTPNGY